MGIEVKSHEVDDKTGSSRLSVKFGRGVVEAPFRFVNRNDLTAKSTVGAGLQLTTDVNPFVYELPLNPTSITSIQTTNDFLARTLGSVRRVLRQVNPGAMKIFYPHFTGKADQLLRGAPQVSNRVSAFILNLVEECEADACALPYDLLENGGWALLKSGPSRDRPVIPVVKIGDNRSVERALDEVPDLGGPPTPFLAFTHASFTRAYLSYTAIINKRRELHSRGIGVMVLGSRRNLGGNEDVANLSGPHYSSFLVADAVAAAWVGRAPISNELGTARVFERSELSVPLITGGHDASEHEGEDDCFASDPELDRLFWRTLSRQNTDRDWDAGRPSAISRLHEVVMSSGEFGVMRKTIVSGELADYRRSKQRLAALVERETQERTAL